MRGCWFLGLRENEWCGRLPVRARIGAGRLALMSSRPVRQKNRNVSVFFNMDPPDTAATALVTCAKGTDLGENLSPGERVQGSDP